MPWRVHRAKRAARFALLPTTPRQKKGGGRAFRVTTAFWRVIKEAATRHEADIVLIDVGPKLGAINRAALVAWSYGVMPVAPDLSSLQGLKNLGPPLRQGEPPGNGRAPRCRPR